jgi:ATP/maltotriose-dependent transcriptional regulator MalT
MPTSLALDPRYVLWSAPEAQQAGRPLIVLMHGWSYVSTIHDDLIEHSVNMHWPGEPVWPDQPLTHSENRVLRYLPTHLSAREIADELCLSANTVKTHLRHLYQKLDAHSRHDAVQRARVIGLLTVPSRTP